MAALKSRGNNSKRLFLDVFRVAESKSGVHFTQKIFDLDISRLSCLVVHNCSPDCRNRRQTEAGESINESNEGRGGNNGLLEADGFDGDQYMDIMKWRNEVVKDGKEGRVVADEDNCRNYTVTR